MNTIIYMLAAVLCGLFALQSLVGDHRDPVRQAFMVVGALASVCYAGFTLYLVPGLTGWRYVHSLSGAFLPVALLWFLERLFSEPHHPASRTVRQMWVLTPLVAVTFVVVDLVLYRQIPRASVTEVLLSLYVLGGFGLCLRFLWRQHQQTESSVARARIRYLLVLLGAAVGFTALEQLARGVGPVSDVTRLGLLNRSAVLQGAFPPVGALFGTLSVYFLQQVVQLYRLLDLHEVFSRLFTLAVSAMVLVGIDGVTVFWVGSQSNYPIHGTFQIFLASALFLTLYDPLRVRVEALARDWFNRQGQRLDVTLTETEGALAKAITLEGLGNELLGRLQGSGRMPLVALFLWDEGRGCFQLMLQRGHSDRPMMRAIAPRPFAEGFQEGVRSYERRELEAMLRRPGVGAEVAAVRMRGLDAMCADLVIALVSGELVIGWLAMQTDQWSDGFSQEEVRRLVGVVDRAAVVLENIHSFELVKERHRLAALGTMSAGLAHEIRNPLAGIKGAAQYLQTSGPEVDPDEVRDFMGIIVGEVNRLDKVVSQFLDYARPFEIRPAAVDPRDLVGAVVELVRAEGLPADVSLNWDAEAGLPEVCIDPDRIRQVLLNLVRNAVQAVGPAGSVVVHLGRGRQTGGARRDRGALEMSVRDDGAGIESADLEKLFIPFFTTKRDGTGLGLAISRRLVEAHGGEINVRSTPGQGSVFTVRLPVAPSEEAPPAEATAR